VLPEKVQLAKDTPTVYLADVYTGNGLKGIPKGSVKKLRVYEFHYAYPQMGGHINVGVEGPWDVHRILGTVPVFEDGSAIFKVPSNIPIAVQPLDEKGRTLQMMRSWFVAMPGENLSCVGCHEKQNTSAPPGPSMAARHAPMDIEPWYGPARGFSWKRDVQPVLDQYCAGCHNAEGKAPHDLTAKAENGWSNFTPSYLELHPFVRRPGPESDYRLQKPMEYHVSTSELVQMLEKGHHGVQLDAEAWDRLNTWIDLNVPDHGTWGEHQRIPGNFHERRIEMRAKYAGRPEDPEEIPDLGLTPRAFVPPADVVPPAGETTCEGWPFDTQTAAARQSSAGLPPEKSLDLGNGVTMHLVLVPAGEFIMGDAEGNLDEMPTTRAAIAEPFYMGRFEVTNAQYDRFDPGHSEQVLDQQNKDHTMPGYPVNGPNLPAIRMTWKEAMAFCQWLSAQAGTACTLPTEAQWEWACRAGTAMPLSYGGLDTDFAPFANLADARLKEMAVAGVNPQPVPNPDQYQAFLPRDDRFDDQVKLMADAGQYQPNAWGLSDMHGNVWEWTRSLYAPYPYGDADGRNDENAAGRRVARGGSWYDRPHRARSAFRLAYEPYQPVYNVGFRVVCPAK
jgi:formylglycine-generating enzyme required for sulfatase activity